MVYNPGIGRFGFNPKYLGREIESCLYGRAKNIGASASGLSAHFHTPKKGSLLVRIPVAEYL